MQFKQKLDHVPQKAIALSKIRQQLDIQLAPLVTKELKQRISDARYIKSLHDVFQGILAYEKVNFSKDSPTILNTLVYGDKNMQPLQHRHEFSLLMKLTIKKLNKGIN